MKSTRERLTSIADAMELWQKGTITEARAIMFVHGITSAHIHDLLMTNVVDVLEDIKDMKWKQIQINPH